MEFPAFSSKIVGHHFLKLSISHPISHVSGALTINGSTVNVHDSTLTSFASLQLISTATSGAKKWQIQMIQRFFFIKGDFEILSNYGVIYIRIEIGIWDNLHWNLGFFVQNGFWKEPDKHGIPWFAKLPFLPGLHWHVDLTILTFSATEFCTNIVSEASLEFCFKSISRYLNQFISISRYLNHLEPRNQHILIIALLTVGKIIYLPHKGVFGFLGVGSVRLAWDVAQLVNPTASNMCILV